MDLKNVYQMDVREWIEHSWGNEIMIPIYGSRKDSQYNIFLQSYLVPRQKAEEQLEKDTCEISTLEPGFTQYGAWEDGEVVYSRYNSHIGAEPLVIVRDYNGLAEDTLEIAEEFRLLFNLYFNAAVGEYFDLGNETIVVRIKDTGLVEVHKKYLKSYLAVKQMVLVLHIDSRCVFQEYDASIREVYLPYRSDDNSVYYTLSIGESIPLGKKENYSILLGKKLVFGCDVKECGIWPYNEEKEFIDFIIDTDDVGNEISFTSDPAKLSNSFGTNPGSPHYLTPVFFKAEVLNKYYSKPERYKVEDGIIRCGTLWSLYIDNPHDGYLSAYLGDLGKCLPSVKEQHYWRGFNIGIDGYLSDAKIRRDFLSQHVNSESADFVFKDEYVALNRMFKKKNRMGLVPEIERKRSI